MQKSCSRQEGFRQEPAARDDWTLQRSRAVTVPRESSWRPTRFLGMGAIEQYTWFDPEVVQTLRKSRAKACTSRPFKRDDRGSSDFNHAVNSEPGSSDAAKEGIRFWGTTLAES